MCGAELRWNGVAAPQKSGQMCACVAAVVTTAFIVETRVSVLRRMGVVRDAHGVPIERRRSPVPQDAEHENGDDKSVTQLFEPCSGKLL